MVVVRMEIIIRSGDYLNTYAEPKARRPMEVGPQTKHPLCTGSQHCISLLIGNLHTSRAFQGDPGGTVPTCTGNSNRLLPKPFSFFIITFFKQS